MCTEIFLVDQLKKAISQFGEVTRCEIVGEKLFITIEGGWSIDLKRTIEFQQSLADAALAFPVIDRYRTDENHCELILKKQ